MKVLVIGSKGFIGSNAYSFFSKSSTAECWGADVMVDYIDKRYFLIDSSEIDFNDVFQSVRFDICINCSGAASVSDSLQNPLRDFTLNVFNVGKMLESIRKYAPECKFINFSSAAVYGNPATLPVQEDIEPKPLSPYGWHKLYSEQLCSQYHKFFGIPTLSLRVFSAYGPGLKKQLFWDLFQKSKEHSRVNIYGTGRESRDFIHINDLLNVLQLAIDNSNFQGGVVNVANGKETYIEDVAREYLNMLNAYPVFTGEMKQGDPSNWVADIHQITSWGYKPQVSLQNGLKEYIQWVKELS